MITVVSLNPSIDRTLTLSTFRAGGTNRAQSVRVDAGGKGVNVCLHLKALGAEDVRCIGFMRRADEMMFTGALQSAGVDCRWLMLPGHVRTNTKICAENGELTEINESGEPVPEDMVGQMLDMCRDFFAQARVVVLTGSIPPGVPKDIYAQMIAIAHEAGAMCLLDADGDALRLGLAAKPDFIKPNCAELECLLGRRMPDEAALVESAKTLMGRGVPYGCISLGGDGALFFSKEWLLSMPALSVPVRSTVGAGDAMTAAFTLGLAKQMGEKETFCLAVAASAAAVSTEGTQPVENDLVQKLLKFTAILLREIGGTHSSSRSVVVISSSGARPIDESERCRIVQRQIAQLFVSDKGC